jgi:hypothetical protein
LFGPKKYEMVWYKELKPFYGFDENTGSWAYAFSPIIQDDCNQFFHGAKCTKYKLKGVVVTPDYTSHPFSEPWIGIQRYIFVFPPKHGKLRIEKVRSKHVQDFLIQNGLSEKGFPMPTSEQISDSRYARGVRLGRKADEILLTRQRKREEDEARNRELERERLMKELYRKGRR